MEVLNYIFFNKTGHFTVKHICLVSTLVSLNSLVVVIPRFNYHFYWIDQNYIYLPLTLSEHFSCLGLGNDSVFLPWSSKGDQLVLRQFHSLVARNRGDSSHIASDMPSQVSFSETCKTSRQQRYSLALTTRSLFIHHTST